MKTRFRQRTFARLFETLEPRQMMDATAPYMIYGTPGNDVITVTAQQQTTASTGAQTRAFRKANVIGAANAILWQVTINNNGVVSNVTVPTGQRIRIEAGDGNDRIQANGQRGMELIGGAGNDTLIGGGGGDILAGGDGTDTADYSARNGNLNITLDDMPNDGGGIAGSEHDNVYADIEIVNGGMGNDYISAANVAWSGRHLNGLLGNDTLVGSDQSDTMDGGAGDDLIYGGKGTDFLYGGAGNDTIHGGEGMDYSTGDDGNDVLYADNGGDYLFGNNGDDRLYGGSGIDHLYGYAGNDTLVSIGGGQSDVLTGGTGLDNFWLDSEATEKVTDFDPIAEYRVLHRVASFDRVHVNGQDQGPTSRELLGQSLPDPATNNYTYRNFSGTPLFGSAGPIADDVHQGSADDCYLLAPLAGVAKRAPNDIRRSIVDLGDGTFAVDFKDGNGTVDHFIRVDADLPTYSDGSLAYAGLGKQNSLWVPLMEKAWAFFRTGFGSYASTGFGYVSEAFNVLGLHNSSSLPTSQLTMTNTITALLNLGQVVTVSTSPTATNTVQFHVYTVDHVTTNSAGQACFVLRNPWGTPDGPGADANNDGYVTFTAAQLFHDFTGVQERHGVR